MFPVYYLVYSVNYLVSLHLTTMTYCIGEYSTYTRQSGIYVFGSGPQTQVLIQFDNIVLLAYTVLQHKKHKVLLIHMPILRCFDAFAEHSYYLAQISHLHCKASSVTAPLALKIGSCQVLQNHTKDQQEFDSPWNAFKGRQGTPRQFVHCTEMYKNSHLTTVIPLIKVSVVDSPC